MLMLEALRHQSLFKVVFIPPPRCFIGDEGLVAGYEGDALNAVPRRGLGSAFIRAQDLCVYLKIILP